MRRDSRILLATAVCAAGVPVTAARWVQARTAGLAEHLGTAGGGTARIDAVDADLSGTIRLSDVAFGDLVTAHAIEASIAIDSLLAGTLRVDEIRVAGPRVAIQVDGNGDSDLARLARRLLGKRPGAGDRRAGPGRLRRIVVNAGSLSAHIAGIGELTADGVELVPDGDGVRVITGPVRVDGRAGALGVELGFTRSAAELTLPRLQFGRVLAVGGTGAIDVRGAPGVFGTSGTSGPPSSGDRRVRLREVSAGRLAADAALELRATVDDQGIPRPLAIDVKPRELTIGEAVSRGVGTPTALPAGRGTSPVGSIAIRGERIPLGALAALAPRGALLDAAHATGSLAVRRDATRVLIEVDGTVDGVSLDHGVIAATPVPLAGAVHASIVVSPEAIAAPRVAIDLGAAHLTASGWLRRGDPASGQLDLSLATAACGDLLASLPAELRGPLDGMVLAGSLGGRVRLAVDLAAPAGDGVDLTASITDRCRPEIEPPAADVARLASPTDQVFADKSHARVGPGEPGWAPLRELPPYVAGAFVGAEDARFYDHAGFDLAQIGKSLEIDLREHRLARGGSTISQQLVKNAFLSQRRSFDRKLQEAILTWRLEARLDKRQILERYLNIIELGPRVFGLTAAAKHWFGAAPRELSVRQAAFLAALTSEPTSMSRRVRRAGGLDADSAARVDVVLRAMRRDGVIDAAQLTAAAAAGLRFAPAALEPER